MGLCVRKAAPVRAGKRQPESERCAHAREHRLSTAEDSVPIASIPASQKQGQIRQQLDARLLLPLLSAS